MQLRSGLVTLLRAEFQPPEAQFIATQLDSTGRPVELSCVAMNGA